MMKTRRQSRESGSLFKVFKDLIPPGQKRSVRSEVNFKVEKTQTCNLRLFAKTFKDKLKEVLISCHHARAAVGILLFKSRQINYRCRLAV